jgi:hypothetical protein
VAFVPKAWLWFASGRACVHWCGYSFTVPRTYGTRNYHLFSCLSTELPAGRTNITTAGMAVAWADFFPSTDAPMFALAGRYDSILLPTYSEESVLFILRSAAPH